MQAGKVYLSFKNHIDLMTSQTVGRIGIILTGQTVEGMWMILTSPTV